ncbi:tetratricopeptide repeat protein [Clostridioides sp. ZZV14-6345]|uniref:tetratricopeptide repeat protein n=1 Tax=Clostridioides sp. ZZV14-6345 TaxID=2811496 RepID=UPI001D12CF12|nr:hypothetical protein [Clostridioides sp. ZZV14-6345]
MRGRVILLISILSIFLVGCSFNKKYEINLTEQGKTYLEKHDYKKAMESLSSALEEDNTNENARAMYMQAMRMSNVTEFEDLKNYEDAIKELKLIEKIKNGSSVIKEEATKKKEELTKLEKEQNEAEEQRKKKAKDTAGEDRYRVESDARKSSYSTSNKSNKSSSKNSSKKSDDNNNNSSQNQEKPNNSNPTPSPTPPDTSGGNSQSSNNQ